MKRFLVFLSLGLVLSPVAEAGGFSPTDLNNLELFFISTDFGPEAIATCNTQSCYDEVNSEIISLDRMYCDTSPGAIPGAVGYAPEGCVRWWEDQGSHDCGACGIDNHSGEWITGHEHGQDDLQKPAYVSDCLNGQPCGRIPTVAEMGGNASQMACWELQSNDSVQVNGDFSILFLVAPRDQADDWWYFGNANNGLRHNVVDDSLTFRAGATPAVLLTGPNAVDVSGGQWHLIEIYRNQAGAYRIFVNGEEVTLAGAETNTASYEHRYLGAQICNGTNGGMIGDVAAFALYSDFLNAAERDQIRAYFESVFTLSLLFRDGFESGDTSAWSSANS